MRHTHPHIACRRPRTVAVRECKEFEVLGDAITDGGQAVVGPVFQRKRAANGRVFRADRHDIDSVFTFGELNVIREILVLHTFKRNLAINEYVHRGVLDVAVERCQVKHRDTGLCQERLRRQHGEE
jgi:hypothetical protein